MLQDVAGVEILFLLFALSLDLLCLSRLADNNNLVVVVKHVGTRTLQFDPVVAWTRTTGFSFLGTVDR
jgi:hypothetical protein